MHNYDEATIAAFHSLYVATYAAHRKAPTVFTDHECNRVLTAVMAAKVFSWKVIGITEAALRKFAELDFKYVPKTGITRAHKVPRIETVRQLLNRPTPLGAQEFIDHWISFDQTVLCAKGENKATIPPYIDISNDDGRLFSSNGKLAGWRHGKEERDLLKQLYADHVEA